MPRLPDAYDARPVARPSTQVVSVDNSLQSRAMAQGARELGAAADKWQREEDIAAVSEARQKLDQWERDSIFDPEKGAINRRGKDAFGVPEQLGKSFEDASAQIGANLNSPRAKQAYQELVQSRRSQVGDWAVRHATKERDSYETGQYQADIAGFQQRASLYADDPAKVAGELMLARERTVGFMRARGRSEEEIGQAIVENEGKVHAGVVTALIASDDSEKAGAYLSLNRDKLPPAFVATTEKAIRESGDRKAAQTYADDVMGRGLPYSDAIAEARGKYEGTQEQAVVAELKTRYAEVEAGKSIAAKQDTDSAWRVITGGGSRRDIDPVLWNRLPADEQRQIQDYQEAKWRRSKADAEGKKEENWGAYMALRDMARENPEKFLEPDTILKAEPYLSKSQMSALVTLRDSINKGEAKAMDLVRVAKHTETMVLADMKAAGIDTTPKEGTAKAKELAAFRGALSMALDAAQAEKGSSLTQQEAKAVGMSMLREGVEQGSGVFGMFQTKKRGFEIISEGAADKTYIAKPYSDIPPAIRQQLEATLYPNGRPRTIYGALPVDEAQIERMYTRGLEQGRFK